MTGGFSSVNRRQAFDTEVLLPNLTETKNYKDFQKDYNQKVCYNIRPNKEKNYTKKESTKILKLDEKNQYGNSMTKPLPTGCIKENSDISQRTYNLWLKKVSLDDQIGHLNVVDIKFDHTKATENQIVYNEIYPSITEK